MFFELGTGRLFLLLGETDIHEWDSLSAPPKAIIWRSRLYSLPGPVNFGAILVEADDFTAPDPANAVRVYADGILRATITTFNEAVRLPSGFLALRWEVEIIGTVTVTSITVAHTPTEIGMP